MLHSLFPDTQTLGSPVGGIYMELEFGLLQLLEMLLKTTRHVKSAMVLLALWHQEF